MKPLTDTDYVHTLIAEEEIYMMEAAAQLYCIPEVEYTLQTYVAEGRQAGISRRAAEHLLAKFVRYDIVEPAFENQKFYFRMKSES